jgi:tRNA G18 (ribose-2'-O)-methylase SpoU
MNYRPFSVVRLREEGSNQGKDKTTDLFCIRARGNQELVRTGESPECALLNGSMGKGVRADVQRLCDALNEAWARHYGLLEEISAQAP